MANVVDMPGRSQNSIKKFSFFSKMFVKKTPEFFSKESTTQMEIYSEFLVLILLLFTVSAFLDNFKGNVTHAPTRAFDDISERLSDYNRVQLMRFTFRRNRFP